MSSFDYGSPVAATTREPGNACWKPDHKAHIVTIRTVQDGSSLGIFFQISVHKEKKQKSLVLGFNHHSVCHVINHTVKSSLFELKLKGNKI